MLSELQKKIQSEKNKLYYEKTKEEKKKKSREYYEKNKEAILAKKNEKRKLKREEINRKAREYYEKNRLEILERKRKKRAEIIEYRKKIIKNKYEFMINDRTGKWYKNFNARILGGIK